VGEKNEIEETLYHFYKSFKGLRTSCKDTEKIECFCKL